MTELVDDAVVTHFEDAEPGVRRRLALADPAVKSYLDEVLTRIASNRAVEHPFLNEYRIRTLDPKQERHLFSECFYFFRYLPFYITGMAIKSRDEMILREIVLNVVDEVGEDPTHSTIFKNFLAAIGITQSDLDDYPPLDETTALNEGIRRLYTETSITKALGALYADETMSAIMVSKLNDGLANQGYDEDIRKFWAMHATLEVGHSNSVFNAIAPYVHEAEARELFEEGAFEFLRLVESYWDAVQRLVGWA